MAGSRPRVLWVAVWRIQDTIRVPRGCGLGVAGTCAECVVIHHLGCECCSVGTWQGNWPQT